MLAIADGMKFKASEVSMIGLRIPEKLLAVASINTLVEMLGLRSETSFPFLESSKPLRHYRKVLVSLDYVEYGYAETADVGSEVSHVSREQRQPVSHKHGDD